MENVPVAGHADNSDGLDGAVLEEGELNVLQRQTLDQAGEDGLQALIEGTGGKHSFLGTSHLAGDGKGK